MVEERCSVDAAHIDLIRLNDPGRSSKVLSTWEDVIARQ